MPLDWKSEALIEVTSATPSLPDKGELSKLIGVAPAIPQDLIDTIGPAPKAGRRRSLALADALQEVNPAGRTAGSRRS